MRLHLKPDLLYNCFFLDSVDRVDSFWSRLCKLKCKISKESRSKTGSILNTNSPFEIVNLKENISLHWHVWKSTLNTLNNMYLLSMDTVLQYFCLFESKGTWYDWAKPYFYCCLAARPPFCLIFILFLNFPDIKKKVPFISFL